jgi:hypothetical protein
MLNHKFLVAFLLGLLALTFVQCPARGASLLDNVSVDTLAAFRADLDGNWDHGAGLDVGYDFNKYVAGHGRILAYSNNEWRGPAIDEVSLLGEATFLRSEKRGFTLGGIGGGDYDVGRDDFGLSLGLRAEARLAKHVSIVAEGRYRMWREGQDDLPLTVGVNWRF